MQRMHCAWLFSLVTVFPRFIHVVACISTVFLMRNNISSYGYTTFSLSIYELVDNCDVFRKKKKKLKIRHKKERRMLRGEGRSCAGHLLSD